MKIVNIIGGLGNQMFQYAFAFILKKKFPDEQVLVDVSHYGHIFFHHYKGANLHNGFEVHKVFPNAAIAIASPWQLMKVTWYMPNYVLSRIIRRILPVRKTEIIQHPSQYFAHHKEYFDVKGDCYFEGIWESVTNYIPYREEIQHLFAHGTPNQVNASYIQEMEKSASVGVHIRRGDYLYCPDFLGITDLDYYQRGINEILKDQKEHVFYIFSNDLQWCELNIVPLCKNNKVVMVRDNTGENSCWDMFLMSHCKDLIIANSTFSWWGAFLNNQGGRVIAPQKWMNKEMEFDIWLNEWIKL